MDVRASDVHLVFYEQMVSSPDLEFRRIYDFLDLPCIDATFAAVKTSSIGKNTPAEIDPPVRELADALWARFEALEVKPGVSAAY